MDKATVDARFRVILLVWVSLLAGVTLFTLVVLVLTTGMMGDWTPTLDGALAAQLLILPVSSMAGGIIFRRRVLQRSSDPAGGLTAYGTQVIVGAALQEGGGLLGLAIALLAGQPTWALGVWGVTAIVMGLTRPSREELDRLLR